MYNKIFNPINNNIVSINTKLGRNILKKYIKKFKTNNLLGGAAPGREVGDRLIKETDARAAAPEPEAKSHGPSSGASEAEKKDKAPTADISSSRDDADKSDGELDILERDSVLTDKLVEDWLKEARRRRKIRDGIEDNEATRQVVQAKEVPAVRIEEKIADVYNPEIIQWKGDAVGSAFYPMPEMPEINNVGKTLTILNFNIHFCSDRDETPLEYSEYSNFISNINPDIACLQELDLIKDYELESEYGQFHGVLKDLGNSWRGLYQGARVMSLPRTKIQNDDAHPLNFIVQKNLTSGLMNNGFCGNSNIHKKSINILKSYSIINNIDPRKGGSSKPTLICLLENPKVWIVNIHLRFKNYGLNQLQEIMTFFSTRRDVSVIMVGDFNMMKGNKHYNDRHKLLVSNNFVNFYDSVNMEHPTTFIGKTKKPVAECLDYIYYRIGSEDTDFRLTWKPVTYRINLSDHNPFSVEINWENYKLKNNVYI